MTRRWALGVNSVFPDAKSRNHRFLHDVWIGFAEHNAALSRSYAVFQAGEQRALRVGTALGPTIGRFSCGFFFKAS